MKKITLLFFLFLGINSFGQQLYIEAGKTLSSFDYKNSNGSRLDNLQATSQSFMTMGYRKQILTKNLYGSVGTSYAGYGAIGSDDTVGNFFEWNMNYLEFNVGLDYELLTMNKFKFYVKGTASAEFLLQGTQTLNSMVIDLKNNDDFDKTLFDFRGGLGVSHKISDDLSFYVQFMYGKSLKLKDGTANTNDQEELRIISKNVSFGLLINLSNKN
ncbi:MAG: outer membrane beta-barrel protein [Lutibacter sp.]|uniref:outer membrane beta-barrel protein n=1 Tax=Lutibacter sp. TaxID=1925666 RepID=UPI00178DD100|nr:outer membrane beta-barrel protein [Lutibacter sp.]MBT8318086.1 outer membrane beta-barrel protein [Lutibacter sp.]NNJ58946.1 outer membrane beta-barrel protein [Lutibacter sp.]